MLSSLIFVLISSAFAPSAQAQCPVMSSQLIVCIEPNGSVIRASRTEQSTTITYETSNQGSMTIEY